ncbi:MAG: NupC/NupG family nucleoside CNT transporter [Luteibaculum sp.]
MSSILEMLRPLLGLSLIFGICYLLSSDRKKIKWANVGKGVFLQLLIALLVLKVPIVETLFSWISSAFVKVISFSDAGASFLFSSFSSGRIEGAMVNFITQVIPTVIFFAALSAMLYHWGILQRVVGLLAGVMRRFLGLSGPESLSAAGNIFLGQTEAPLLIRPYLKGMSKSELHCVMTAGMATIAGAVLAAYIGFLGGESNADRLYFARHLLTASLMSAPAAIVVSKILHPAKQEVNYEHTKLPKTTHANVLEAIVQGTTEGLKLAANVAAMLLVFIGIMALANYVLKDMLGEWLGLNSWIAENTGFEGMSFQFIIGTILSPLVWCLGVPASDMMFVGQLLGEKTILNEFVAYLSLSEMINSGQIGDKSILISTYMLCGFSNFASIGIQIGGIGALEPSRKADLSKLALKAMIGGNLACLLTATIVGMLEM